MSSSPLDINLTTLEHAHMCFYEASLLSQPSLSEALLLVVPASDIKSLLDSKMQQHFVEVPQARAAHCSRMQMYDDASRRDLGTFSQSSMSCGRVKASS